LNTSTLKIVADAHIWGAQSAFGSLPGFDVDLQLLESHQITHEVVDDADVLLTRSSTRVDAGLLEETAVRFAGTATIGDDHYDKAWLERAGIVWANAAGSSTGSVIEYMVSALLELHAGGYVHLPDLTLGVIGVGRIGSALSERASAMGIHLLLNDPPRARREENGDLDPLDLLLQQADVLTLHTPLIREGVDRTYHLLDRETLSRFRGRGVINAARGSCVDNAALADWLDADPERFAVIDCWENEPALSRRLLVHDQVVIATPHIAGHSLDGKAANTEFVYDALCRFLGLEPQWRAASELPPVDQVNDVVTGENLWSDLYRMVAIRYSIKRDDQEMRGWFELSDQGRADAFGDYRRHYPVRRKWQLLPLHLNSDPVTPELMALAVATGIKVAEEAA